MPPQSPEEAVAMTDSHLEYLTTTNDQYQRFKGQTGTVLSILDTLQSGMSDTKRDRIEDDIKETREAAETLKDQLEYWIESTTELRDVIQTTNATIRVAEGMTDSLAEIDEGLSERLGKLQTTFEKYHDTTESVNDNIETGIELLERLVILLIDAPESDEIREISTRLTEIHQTIKERLDIE